LKIFRTGSDPSRALQSFPSRNRRLGVTAFVGLTVLLCSGATSPTGCQPSGSSIGPSTGEVVGAAIGAVAVVTVAVVVLVEVNHSHHTLKGCVSEGPNGLQLQTGDSKTYSLDGDAATVKAGDRVKLHGSRVKKTKDSKGDQIFKVEKLNKDFGPCRVTSAPAASPAQ